MLENLMWIAVGAAIIMLLPPKYEDWLRTWLVNQWKKLTKKG